MLTEWVDVMRGQNGHLGKLRWGYHDAGTLRAWTISRHRQTRVLALRGQVVWMDAWKLRQRPLAFVVMRAGGQAWEYPIDTIELGAGLIVATLGRQAPGQRGFVYGA